MIQTEALRELSVPNNSISYVLGRKGTGKTRLLRELAKAKIGEALLVDSNSKDGKGLKSPSPELSRAADIYKDAPEKLWWHLLSAAILDAFEGLKTPFKLDECISELASKVDIDAREIRTSIERMKNVGMFEDRPDYPGQLRVGRLFKSSLRMKYVRGKNS